MRYAEVAENVKALVKESPTSEEFVYQFLLAYGTPNASIARLKSGQMNLAKANGELLLKKKLYFKAVSGEVDKQKCGVWPPKGSHIRMSAPFLSAIATNASGSGDGGRCGSRQATRDDQVSTKSSPIGQSHPLSLEVAISLVNANKRLRFQRALADREFPVLNQHHKR